MVATAVQPGPPGPPGPQGPPGGGVDAYTHHQDVLAATWTITHPLPYQPAVTTVDSGDNVVEGAIHYLSATQLEVSFVVAMTGTAYLS